MLKRVRYSIRTLLLVTALSSVCALVIRTNDWIAALGIAIAACIVLFASRLPLPHWSRALVVGFRGAVVLLGAVIAWFSMVDRSYGCEWCDHCTEHRFVDEYRVCGIPVWTLRGKNHVDCVSRLRTDLGISCSHRYQREHLERAWGLVYLARPRIAVTCCLDTSDYYSEQVSLRVRQFAVDNPEAARCLYDRVFKHEDYDAMHAFIATMKAPEPE